MDYRRPLANGLGVRLPRNRHAHQSHRGRQGANERASERRLLLVEKLIDNRPANNSKLILKTAVYP